MNIKTLITIILILITTKINAVVIDKESRKQLLSIDNQYSRKVGQIEAWNNANPEYRGSCTATNLNRRFIITNCENFFFFFFCNILQNIILGYISISNYIRFFFK